MSHELSERADNKQQEIPSPYTYTWCDAEKHFPLWLQETKASNTCTSSIGKPQGLKTYQQAAHRGQTGSLPPYCHLPTTSLGSLFSRNVKRTNLHLLLPHRGYNCIQNGVFDHTQTSLLGEKTCRQVPLELQKQQIIQVSTAQSKSGAPDGAVCSF